MYDERLKKFGTYTKNFEVYGEQLTKLHTYIPKLLWKDHDEFELTKWLVITTLQSALRPSCSHHFSLCALILYMSGRAYNIKLILKDIFLRRFFTAILFTFRVFATNLLRGSRPRNIFVFSFWCLTWDLNSGLTSNKPTYHLLDYGI